MRPSDRRVGGAASTARRRADVEQRRPPSRRPGGPGSASVSAAGRVVAPSATASLQHGRRRARRARRRSPSSRVGELLRSALTLRRRAPRRRGRPDGGRRAPAAARCIAQPGLALATTRRADALGGPVDRRHLALADRAGQLGLQRRVGAAGAAAQAVVVELDDVGDAGEHACAPARGPAARGAGGTGPGRSPAPSGAAGAGSSSSRSASHSWTSTHPCRERRRLGGAEQVAVVLHRRAAAGGVDEDRRRRPASTRIAALGEPLGLVARGRRGRAGRRSTPRRVAATGERGAGSAISRAVARCVARIQASITQPVNSQTSPPVGAHRRPAPQRQAGQPEPPRHQPQPLGDGEQRRPGEQRPVVAEHAERQRAASAVRDGRSSARACRGALDQVAERHPARARRLAAAALHARLHEAHELVVDRRAAPLHGAHRVDATPRRQPLLAGRPGTSGSAAGTARSATHDDSSSSSRCSVDRLHGACVTGQHRGVDRHA